MWESSNHTSLEKANKNSKIKKLKPKAQELKPLNNFLGITEISNKAWKEKKKHQRQKRDEKNSNIGSLHIDNTLASRIDITNNFSEKKYIQTDQNQLTY